jgi:hypothetical protein
MDENLIALPNPHNRNTELPQETFKNKRGLLAGWLQLCKKLKEGELSAKGAG